MRLAKNLRDTERKLITSARDLPDFERMTPEEEAEFWESHDFAEGVLEEGADVDAEVQALLADRLERE